MLQYLVSRAESDLLEEIQALGYGEVYDLTPPRGKPEFPVRITEKTVGFLKFLRYAKTPFKLVVHDGEPTGAEFEARLETGHRCLKKIRF
jgi:hypothetical protein